MLFAIHQKGRIVPIVKSCAFIMWNEVAKNNAKGRDFGHNNQTPTVRSKTNPPMCTM